MTSTDPLQFRNDYVIAGTATATRTETSPFGDTWAVAVTDRTGQSLGAPQPIRFAGPFSGSGIDLAGAALLDLEVLATNWAQTSDDTWTSPAHSQRA